MECHNAAESTTAKIDFILMKKFSQTLSENLENIVLKILEKDSEHFSETSKTSQTDE